jgi:hypothetical protein
MCKSPIRLFSLMARWRSPQCSVDPAPCLLPLCLKPLKHKLQHGGGSSPRNTYPLGDIHPRWVIRNPHEHCHGAYKPGDCGSYRSAPSMTVIPRNLSPRKRGAGSTATGSRRLNREAINRIPYDEHPLARRTTQVHTQGGAKVSLFEGIFHRRLPSDKAFIVSVPAIGRRRRSRPGPPPPRSHR